jgi:2',3'-cyclic-nucleotide 2'-phosphodiesterase / 3'-nucleotidase / 5'-nucleotidase
VSPIPRRGVSRLVAVLTVTVLAVTTLVMAPVASVTPVASAAASPARIDGRLLGSATLGGFDAGATGALAWHAPSQSVLSANREAGTLDVIDLSDPAAPQRVRSIELGGRPSGVAVHGDIVAVAVHGADVADRGRVVLLDPEGGLLGSAEVGVGPAMLAFTPRGSRLLTADEGEPSPDYSVDPAASVTIIDLSDGPAAARALVVAFADFDAGGPRAAELHPAIRITGPNASVARDLEPESLAISADGSTAWVSLQENNALAVIDIPSATVRELVPLRSSDLGFAGIDASAADGGINIVPWPLLGMFQPGGLAVYETGARSFLVTANTGALRDLPGFSEAARVRDLRLDPDAFADAEDLQSPENMGDLLVAAGNGDTDDDGDHDILFAAGTRSFSVWDLQSWSLVFDSADEFEQHLAASDPASFNSAADSQPSFDQRSTMSGAEPKALVLGRIDERTYAFIGLAQQGGVMIYDITRPARASLAAYLENRDWAGDPATGTAGDLGPESLLFIEASTGPDGRDLLVVANAVSGTLSVWELVPG